jgi:hypothetical protein
MASAITMVPKTASAIAMVQKILPYGICYLNGSKDCHMASAINDLIHNTNKINTK